MAEEMIRDSDEMSRLTGSELENDHLRDQTLNLNFGRLLEWCGLTKVLFAII